MTKADKKLCLQWNNFSFVFGDLRQYNEFTDVTLAWLETFFITRFPFYFDFADWEIFFMVLPAGKFENPLTCPNIDIGALELTWRG